MKATVKELLQRHRAREANRKNAKTISQACLELQELSASISPSHHVEPCPPLAAPLAQTPDVNLQMCPASYSVTDSMCPSQIQEYHNFQHPLWDVMLPGNSDPSNHHHYHEQQQQQQSGQNYQLTGLPLPWGHGLSSDADYYGPGMTAHSPTDSLKLYSPEDHNSYSPHDSFSSSSSSSSCYDSPSRIESTLFSPENYPVQHYTVQDCHSLGHLWTGQQESSAASEYAPYYYNSPDYAYPCSVEESYYRRDLTSEMCYNAL